MDSHSTPGCCQPGIPPEIASEVFKQFSWLGEEKYDVENTTLESQLV